MLLVARCVVMLLPGITLLLHCETVPLSWVQHAVGLLSCCSTAMGLSAQAVR